MSELLPEPEKGKFDSPRDEVLYAMTLGEWACETSGDVQSPSSWFAWMQNTAEELIDIRRTFAETIQRARLADLSELVGNFVIVEQNDGFVEVIKFDEKRHAERVYSVLEDIYIAWESGSI